MVKNGISLGRADYQWAHEPCFYGSKAGQSPAFFGDRAQHTVWRVTVKRSDGMETTLGNGVILTDGGGNKIFIDSKAPKGKKIRYIRMGEEETIDIGVSDKFQDVWEVARETNTEHPTQKPVEIPIRAIENSTEKGDIVIDFFGGSGSTMMGAEETGRVCCTIELDPKYVDVIVNRYVRATGNRSIMVERDGEMIAYAKLKAEHDKLVHDSIMAAAGEKEPAAMTEIEAGEANDRS